MPYLNKVLIKSFYFYPLPIKIQYNIVFFSLRIKFSPPLLFYTRNNSKVDNINRKLFENLFQQNEI